jgi:hypothetical protein
VTSPLTMVSADFSKIGLPVSVKTLMLVTLPTLQPYRVKKIFLAVTAILAVGLVIFTILSIRVNALLNCFSATPEGFAEA